MANGKHSFASQSASSRSTQGDISHGAVQMLSADPRRPRRGGKRRRSGLRVFSNILLALGVVLLLAAAGLWGFSRWRYYKAAESNARLEKYVTLPEVSDTESDAPEVDWAGLKAVNDDVVGWLYIPGTTINYPVYQGRDNEYYLRHSAEGDWIIAGQLFMDAENTVPGLVDQQSIIYGHHLLDGSMFEQVAALDEQDKFDQVDTVWYVTEQGATELEPLLLYYTHPDDLDVRMFSLGGEDEFRAYLSGLLDKSVTRRADAQQVIDVTSHVLTLSTCNYYDGYGRTIFVCVPKAEADLAQAVS